MLKRVAIMLLCLIMVFIATFGFVVGVVAVPTIYSYAAVDDDPIYVPLRDPSDAVAAFQAYCKSRDLTIEGSLTDAVTTFTTGAFNSACNEIGINISELQAEIKAEYDQAGKPVKFLLNDTGVMAMNRIFAQFLQDNELEVGDTDVNKLVQSGVWFEDDLGNGCYVWQFNGRIEGNPSQAVSSGTYYRFNPPDVLTSLTFPYNTEVLYKSVSYPYYLTNNPNEYYEFAITVSAYSSNVPRYGLIGKRFDNSSGYYGGLVIVQNTATGILGLGYAQTATYADKDNFYTIKQILPFNGSDQNLPTANVYIISNTINNNTYEGDTIINNEGDVIVEPDPVQPGGQDPGWDIGGGDGTATDGNGNTWNIQFPDFQLPDLNIDWSINGLGEKFPFSIPFDLVSLVTVLNAEPMAPRFEGTVNFGFTTWNYDINLQQFDSVAQVCRIAELLLLVVGLILITRSIIKG